MTTKMMIEHTDFIQPRIHDINFAGHLGHTELLNLLHETRHSFLSKYSLNESDIDGHALIVRNLNVTYKSQVYWGNNLEIKMLIKTDGAKILFDYSVKNASLANETAIAEVRMVLINRKRSRNDIFLTS